MKEFFQDKFENEEYFCCILVKSGHLELEKCEIILDGISKEPYRKVPAILVQEGASLTMDRCTLKGDSKNDANTAGVVGVYSKLNIMNC